MNFIPCHWRFSGSHHCNSSCSLCARCHLKLKCISGGSDNVSLLPQWHLGEIGTTCFCSCCWLGPKGLWVKKWAGIAQGSNSRSLGKAVGGRYIRAQRPLGEAVDELLLRHKGLWMKQLVGSAPAWRGRLWWNSRPWALGPCYFS